MDTIKLENKGNCLMVAHRGLSGLERENTNSAFVAAGNRSYYGIETDVYKTADGHFVLVHDKDTSRVSEVCFNIEEAIYNDIKSIILKDLDGKVGRSDLRIPDLLDYIEICKKYDKVAVLELKSDFTSEEIASMCEIIKQADYLENVVFIAFGYNNLVRLREIYPKQPAQYLVSKFEEELIEKLKAYDFDLDINYLVLTKEIIDLCHNNGIKVNAWTVDKPEAAQQLLDWGVDYITTNILE